MGSFPEDLEPLLATIVEVLKYDGNAREIEIILNAKISIEPLKHWNDEVEVWKLVLRLAFPFYMAIKPDRTECERIISEAASDFFRQTPGHFLSVVDIESLGVDNPQWRDDAKAYVTGMGITNQGRVRSNNVASRQCDGLLFRSGAEINLYKALKSLGLTFAPLPVFLRGGADYRRLEPDFVIIKDGVVMVVEVDGDTYHRESPADAHARLQPLDHEGAKIERVKAEECESAEKAKACAARLAAILDKRIAQRR